MQGNELDLETALMYTADDMDLYLEVAESYTKEYETKLPLIERLYSEQDWANYAIEVHALKGTSRTIGGTALGDRAERLEKAAKAIVAGNDPEANAALIRAQHAECMLAYTDIVEQIRKVSEEYDG